jgi:hypothetical protein
VVWVSIRVASRRYSTTGANRRYSTTGVNRRYSTTVVNESELLSAIKTECGQRPREGVLVCLQSEHENPGQNCGGVETRERIERAARWNAMSAVERASGILAPELGEVRHREVRREKVRP